MNVTYRKTQSGEWVAYGPSSVVRAGEQVSVTKRDGSMKVELVERTGRPFTVLGTEMVYGYLAARKPEPQPIDGPGPADRRSERRNSYVDEAKRGDVHLVGGTYYRVHIGQHSQRPYVVAATIVSPAVRDADGTLIEPGVVEWDRAAGMIFKLSETTKATAEQAAAFGRLVGRCCFCSTKIDTPESTIAGYGPVCAANYGLPWGDTKQEVAA